MIEFGGTITKALGQKLLQDCDRKFLKDLKLALEELKNCTENLVIDLKSFIFDPLRYFLNCIQNIGGFGGISISLFLYVSSLMKQMCGYFGFMLMYNFLF